MATTLSTHNGGERITDPTCTASVPASYVDQPDASGSVPNPAQEVPSSDTPQKEEAPIDEPGEDYTGLLPPELWLDIFRYCTYIPRSRSITLGDPFIPEQPPNYAWGVNTASASMYTKCALVLVSKAWRMVATELLYEHIVIRSLRKALLILQTLQQSAALPQDNKDNTQISLNHGQWVRHIEIQSFARSTSTVKFIHAIANILTRAPHLQFLSGSWSQLLPKPLTDLIVRYHSQTLLGLSCELNLATYRKGLKEGDTSFYSFGFLGSFQSLRVLSLKIPPGTLSWDHTTIDDEPQSSSDANTTSAPAVLSLATLGSLPEVRTLQMTVHPLLLMILSRISIPKLRNVVLNASYTDNSMSRRPPTQTLKRFLDAFFITHGGSITSLELCPLPSESFSPSSLPLCPALFLQEKSCPNLERLIFDCREIPVVDPSVYDIPSFNSKSKAKFKAKTETVYVPLQNADGGESDEVVKKSVMTQPHYSLREIGIRGIGISRLYPNKPNVTQNHLRTLIGARAAGLLPSLEKVQTLGFLVEGSTDGYAKDIFIWWTEKFEDVGVDLMDGEGVIWLYDDEKPVLEIEKKREREVDTKEMVSKAVGGSGDEEREGKEFVVRGDDPDDYAVKRMRTETGVLDTLHSQV